MSDTALFNSREKGWGKLGLVIMAIGIAVPTYMSADHVTTFVASVGAVGQVGVAIALFAVSSAQWKLQERTAKAEDARREREDRLIADEKLRNLRHIKGELREAIDGFYRSVKAELRERRYEVILETITPLKRDMDSNDRETVAKFMAKTNTILMNTLSGDDDANLRHITQWRDNANKVLALLNEAKLF